MYPFDLPFYLNAHYMTISCWCAIKTPLNITHYLIENNHWKLSMLKQHSMWIILMSSKLTKANYYYYHIQEHSLLVSDWSVRTNQSEALDIEPSDWLKYLHLGTSLRMPSFYWLIIKILRDSWAALLRSGQKVKNLPQTAVLSWITTRKLRTEQSWTRVLRFLSNSYL